MASSNFPAIEACKPVVKPRYELVHADTLGHLEVEVSRRLEDGWHLVGGVAAYAEGNGPRFVQAMTFWQVT